MSGRALAAYDPCGCCAAISVVDSRIEGVRHDPASAYEMAAEQSRRGRRIETVDIDEWKSRKWHCADHPQGPPWWESNGGDGRVPAEYTPQLGMGL